MSAQNCKPRAAKTLTEMLGIDRAPVPGCGKNAICYPRGHGSIEWCGICSKTKGDLL